MKKVPIIFFSVWAIFSVLLYIILVYTILIIPKNNFTSGLKELYKKEEVLKIDFDQVNLEENYSISSFEDGIVVELKEKNAGLKLYYTEDKEFIKSEIIGPAAYTSQRAYTYLWFALAFFSITLNYVVVGIIIGIILEIQNAIKEKRNIGT